ncbi:phage terminase small subunit [Clostridium sp. WILCCON 0269]|uniref:Phage terminase small subunit n=1 Tax=Candidatus Clostridium eludens TaxID=3381663 RepID=A0ABW8SPJ3_9CLOT
MPRQRSPNRDKAKEMYLESGKALLCKDIAKILNVSESQVRNWKVQDNWDNKNKVAQLKRNSCASKRKKGAQPNNKNAQGHGAPARNNNAESHGFFSKYLPEETLEIMDQVEKRAPIDIIWDMIKIKYAAIIRSQGLMYVKDKNDITKVLKREKEYTGETSENWEKEYELQLPWDKQATFLNAESRAMAELRNLIKQYDEMLNSNREMATEEQKARIEVLKSKVPSKDNLNIQEQLNTIADLINKPQEREIEDD